MIDTIDSVCTDGSMAIGQRRLLRSIVDTIDQKKKKIFNRWIDNIDQNETNSIDRYYRYRSIDPSPIVPIYGLSPGVNDSLLWSLTLRSGQWLWTLECCVQWLCPVFNASSTLVNDLCCWHRWSVTLHRCAQSRVSGYGPTARNYLRSPIIDKFGIIFGHVLVEWERFAKANRWTSQYSVYVLLMTIFKIIVSHTTWEIFSYSVRLG